MKDPLKLYQILVRKSGEFSCAFCEKQMDFYEIDPDVFQCECVCGYVEFYDIPNGVYAFKHSGLDFETSFQDDFESRVDLVEAAQQRLFAKVYAAGGKNTMWYITKYYEN